MERLTKEELENYRNTYDKFDGVESNVFEKICNELIEYKSLEEELDIDLPTLFKALRVGIWYKFNNGNICYIPDFCLYLEFYTDKFIFYASSHTGFNSKYIYLKDYGKTWWLEKPKEINDD